MHDANEMTSIEAQRPADDNDDALGYEAALPFLMSEPPAWDDSSNEA